METGGQHERTDSLVYLRTPSARTARTATHQYALIFEGEDSVSLWRAPVGMRL